MKPPVSANVRFPFLVLLYSIVAGLAIQWVFLPYVLPHLHYGKGLMVGGDWVEYHKQAVLLAGQIEREGWGAWSLRPHPFSTVEVGIAAWVYTVFGIKPWVLVLFNSVVHALSAWVLVCIAQRLLPNSLRHIAWLSAVPFAFFPTSLLWISQIHKDGLSIFSCFLFALSLVHFSGSLGEKKKDLYTGTILVWASILLMYPVRRYLILFYLACLVALIAYLFLTKGREKVRLLVVAGTLLFWSSVIYLNWVPTAQPVNGENQAKILVWNSKGEIVPAELEAGKHWARTPWLPKRLDDAFYTLMINRERFFSLHGAAGTNIDSTRKFASAADCLRYIPRALTVGLFFPVPGHWDREPGSVGGGMFRVAVSIEMVVGYVLFFFLFWFMYWKVGHPVGLLLALSWVFFIVWHGMSVPNLGTLHRLRYGPMTGLLGFGLIGIVMAFRRVHHYFNRSVEPSTA